MKKIALLLTFLTICSPALAEEAEDARAVSCLGVGRLRGTVYDLEAGALQPGLGTILDGIAKLYREKCPGALLIIQAHAFEMPTPALNEELSQLRAHIVELELVRRGIPQVNLLAAGRGDTVPLAPASEPEAMQLNRRVTFRVAD